MVTGDWPSSDQIYPQVFKIIMNMVNFSTPGFTAVSGLFALIEPKYIFLISEALLYFPEYKLHQPKYA